MKENQDRKTEEIEVIFRFRISYETEKGRDRLIEEACTKCTPHLRGYSGDMKLYEIERMGKGRLNEDNNNSDR